MYYTVIKHDGHLRTRGKCRKHEPQKFPIRARAGSYLCFNKLYYCSNVWANTTEKNIQKLQAVQNFACRIVSGARKYDHVTSHLKCLSWLPVKDQLYHRQAIMAFKCIPGHAPKYSLPASKLPSVQLGAAKSSTCPFLKQHQDKEHFITELLDFGTI